MDFHEVPLDTVAAYWDKRPCNIRHSDKEVGTKEYFDEVESRKYFVEPHIPSFAKFSHWRGKRVLEIGCGLGTDTISFARAGAEVTAVDLSERSLAVAKRRAEVYQLPVSFYRADAEHLSEVVPRESYDLIYSFGVLHHTPNPAAAFRQLRQYCHSQTCLKAMVYYRYSWKVLALLLGEGRGQFWRLTDIVAQNSEAQSGCPVTYTYGKVDIRRLLEDCDFQLEHAEVHHIFPYRIRVYKRYRYVKEWYFRYLPEWIFSMLERQFGWHLCLTARPV